MTSEKFAALVNQLSEKAEKHPASYRNKVMMIVAMGYSYIFSLLLISLIITFSVIAYFIEEQTFHGFTAKIALIFLLFALYILQSLCVHVPAPPYPVIRKKDAPELYEEIEKLTRQLKGPKIHRILFYEENNAFITQIPLLGPFGWYRNYLVIGIPLMMGHSPEEFRSVIAHEIGHLSKSHGRFSSWIYRIQQTWDILMDTMNKKSHWGTWLLKGFFNRFVPYLAAHTFVLRRMNEYEADLCSGEVSSSETAGKMLIRLNFNAMHLGMNFWPKIYHLADEQAFPPYHIYQQMEEFLLEPIPLEVREKWLERMLEVKTDIADTHPSLADRLKSLGVEPVLPDKIEKSAFREYIQNTEGILSVLNDTWRETQSEKWANRYHYVQDQRSKIAEINEMEEQGQLTFDDALNRAFLVEEIEGVEKSLPYYEQLVIQYPDRPEAHFYYGRILLKQGSEEGVARILNAIEMDEAAALNGYPLIYHYYMEQGKEEEAKKYEEQTKHSYDIFARIEEEKTSVFEGDVFLPHQLPEEFTKELKSILKGFESIVFAYMVQKQLPFPSSEPVFVLGLDVARPLYLLTRSAREEFDKDLANQVRREIGHAFPWLIIEVFTRSRKEIKKSIENVPSSRIR